jgi:hypothetical protein
MYVMDSDEVVYQVIHLTESNGYSEAVLKVQGESANHALHYSIFYRTNWAWLDRENPDFRLVEIVDYFPMVVQ